MSKSPKRETRQVRLLITILATLAWAAEAASGAPIGYWRCDDGQSGENAARLASEFNAAPLAATAGVFQKGVAPVFDAATPAEKIWNGADYALANPANRGALRFVNDGVTGGGSPTGGEVVVAGTEDRTRPADLTVEAFVKMHRQSPRHALIASQRRNGQTGASWSLSIDPQGFLRARFDTQPGANASGGPGFNQSLGSTATLADGAWHHVALTFDHTTCTATLYLDYVRCGGGVTAGPLVYDDGALVFGRGLDGWLDEVRLTAAALHPEQFLRTTQFFSDLKPHQPTVAMLDQTPTRVQTGLKIAWPKVGTLRPKSVDQIKTAMWSLGCETLDRDLADWDAYKAYLQPLGIGHIRLQGGWGRTEKAKGQYDFAWLDRIVDDAHARGLTVCLETSYGNRLYEPQAALGPGGKLPEGDETLAAWDAWVEALARRYSARGVREWMMYNEPNLTRANTIEKTTAFNIRTAQIIKRVDPTARIAGLVSAGANPDFVGGFLRGLKEQGTTDLFDSVVYHHYSANPDATYDKVEQLQELLRELAPQLRLWQGEAGCASEEVQFALSGVDWSEISQAKWNARRMLGDLGRGIRSSVFTISDLSYHKDFISRYGLLKTDSHNALIRVKTVYYAVQNVVAVFNDAVERAADAAVALSSDKKLTCFAYRDKTTGIPLIAFWDGTGVPAHECVASKAQLTLPATGLQQPVWLDLLSGNLYAIPAESITRDGDKCVISAVPVYDSPAVITDQSLLSFTPVRKKK